MRAVREWIGKTPDTAIPARVKLRVIEKHDGRCASCTREVTRRNKPAIDHIKALINGGENRESNLQLLCAVPCHADKTALDVTEKAKVYAVRLKEFGIAPRKSRPMPGSKASSIRKRMDGRVERR